MTYITDYLRETGDVLKGLDKAVINKMVDLLVQVRERQGRLFILGSGGGAGHASHAVNDFRKIAGVEAYAPSDNVSELTARVNDEGWASAYSGWLRISHLNEDDLVMVLSVGGGNLEQNVSP